MHHFQVNFRIQHSTGADRLKSKYIIFLGSTHFTKTQTSSPILQCVLCVHAHIEHTHHSDGVQKKKTRKRKAELKHLKTYRNTNIYSKRTRGTRERDWERSKKELAHACTTISEYILIQIFNGYTLFSPLFHYCYYYHHRRCRCRCYCCCSLLLNSISQLLIKLVHAYTHTCMYSSI